MTIAYFDCFSGISGDMILGAMVDLGLDLSDLTRVLSSLDLEEFRLEAREVASYGFRATKVDVIVPESSLVRTFNNIRDLIEYSPLSDTVKAKSLEIFMRLARAESVVHGKPIDQIHFHEVGAVDSILDIVGAAYGFDALGFTDVFSSPLPLGHGMIKTRHGSIPVPVPAVLEILEETPTYSSGIPTETVTPTGAAVIKSLATSFGNAPPMVLEKTGYGAGTRDLGAPNLLRIITGDPEGFPTGTEELACQISTNIDDMNPEFYDYVIERLLDAGAHDVWLTPIQMKKTRPGTIITVLCSPGNAGTFKRILLEETSTFGLRTVTVMKKAIEREIIDVATSWGHVGVKVGREGSRVTSVSPEFSDCARIAGEHGVPIKEVFQEAQSLARDKLDPTPGGD
ncbi:MAG: nickel pincer cofactor biosynthesis protein LarC [Actinobacteria bacterium]|nr:nickel pincer cofactor biosynthesis protein LarC [Actinomycetota bacterium]MBU4489731.1 nickel pincer cofactor biosynthesis protein LarC [Actinomycetota bacterium]MCG2794410.1 nickel pincer cofactor biosynthesis protein LarC [Actinomycetes bacterium]